MKESTDYCYQLLGPDQRGWTKAESMTKAREYLDHRMATAVGIYKLVAIMRADVQIKIEVLDGDE